MRETESGEKTEKWPARKKEGKRVRGGDNKMLKSKTSSIKQSDSFFQGRAHSSSSSSSSSSSTSTSTSQPLKTEEEEEEEEAENIQEEKSYFQNLIKRLKEIIGGLWTGLLRMITTRPIMLGSVGRPHEKDGYFFTGSLDCRLHENFMDQLDDNMRSHDGERDIMSTSESSGGSTTQYHHSFGLSFPPLTLRGGPQVGCHEEVSYFKHRSDSDLTDMTQNLEDEISPWNSLKENLPPVESTTPNEAVFPMDELFENGKEELEEEEEIEENEIVEEEENDEEEDEESLRILSHEGGEEHVINSQDILKLMSKLDKEKHFTNGRWDSYSENSKEEEKEEEEEEEEEEDYDEEEISSPPPPSLATAKTQPLNMPSPTKKFECSLPTISASPAPSSVLESLTNIQIVLDQTSTEEELTPLQKSLIDAHPPTKPSERRPKKFLEVNDNKGGKLRRASSLKAYTTNEENLETQKKIVRFADVFGLDLANVKTFMDGIPKVPKSAYLYLRDVELSDTESESSSRGIGGSSSSSSRTARFNPPTSGPSITECIVPRSGLIPLFTQPGSTEDFDKIIDSQNLCLECAYISINGTSANGVIAVKNISFEKRVSVRYTLDDWNSYEEKDAGYLSSVHNVDKFSFEIKFPSPLSLNHRLQFCLRYSVRGREFWDSNFGANYVFQSLMKPKQTSVSCTSNSSGNLSYISQSPSCGEDPWHHFV